MRQPATYILASKRNGTLYIGVTSNLTQRIWQHKQHLVDGYCKNFNVTQLVYFELHQEMISAITREKQIKHWRRDWKISLIEKHNPYWRDLYDEIL